MTADGMMHILEIVRHWWGTSMDSATVFGLNATQIKRIAAFGQMISAFVIIVDLLGIGRFRAAARSLARGNRQVRLVRLKMAVFAQAMLGMIALMPAAIPGNPPGSVIMMVEEDRRRMLRKSLRRFRQNRWMLWIYILGVAVPSIWAFANGSVTASHWWWAWIGIVVVLFVVPLMFACMIVPVGFWLLGILISLPTIIIHQINKGLIAWLSHRKLKWSLLLISFCVFTVASLLGIIFA
jgi:hypothetical protein